MTQLGDIRRGLRAIFNALANVGADTADSPDQPWSAPSYTTGAQVSFKLIAMRNAGRDEVRGGYDPDLVIPGDTYDGAGAPLGGYTYEVCGQRVLTFSVRVECDDNSDDATAWPFAENIRAGLKRPSVLASMQDLGLGIASIGPMRDLSFTGKDARTVSVAQFDLVLNAASNITDDPVTTIETVEISQDS